VVSSKKVFVSLPSFVSTKGYVLQSYDQIFWGPVFFCCMSYGVVYMIAGIVAAFAVSSDRIFTKLFVVMFSTVWGLFCGLLAGVIVFSCIAGIYISFPLTME
jgi:hypothetical protein